MSNYVEFKEIKSDYFNSDGEFYGGFTGCSPVKNIMEKMNITIDEMADEIKCLIQQLYTTDISKDELIIKLKKIIDYV